MDRCSPGSGRGGGKATVTDESGGLAIFTPYSVP
jgi:hypothetical protein